MHKPGLCMTTLFWGRSSYCPNRPYMPLGYIIGFLSERICMGRRCSFSLIKDRNLHGSVRFSSRDSRDSVLIASSDSSRQGGAVELGEDPVTAWLHSFLLSYFRKGVARRIHVRLDAVSITKKSLANESSSNNNSKDNKINGNAIKFYLAKDLMETPLPDPRALSTAVAASSLKNPNNKDYYYHDGKGGNDCYDDELVRGDLRDGISESYLGRKVKLLSLFDPSSNGNMTTMSLPPSSDTPGLAKYFSHHFADSIMHITSTTTLNIPNEGSKSESKLEGHKIHTRTINIHTNNDRSYNCNINNTRYNAVVFMPDHLSGLQGPALRLKAIKDALSLLSDEIAIPSADLIRDGPNSKSSKNCSKHDNYSINREMDRDTNSCIQPHSRGLIVVVEKISVFKQRTANDLISGWKTTLGLHGLQFLDHKYIANSGYHVLIFKKTASPDAISESNGSHIDNNNPSIDSNITSIDSANQLWFDSDFVLNKVSDGGDDNLSSNRDSARSKLPVGIIGAGIGGSALALLLQRHKIPCIVFEKDTTFDSRRQGYALTMQQAASTLSALDISDLVAERSVTSYCSESRRFDGSRIGIYGPLVKNGVLLTNEVVSKSDNTSSSNNNNNDNSSHVSSDDEDISHVKSLIDSFLSEGYSRHNLHVPRQVLRRIIVDRLEPGTILWAKRLVGVKAVGATETSVASRQLKGDKLACYDGTKCEYGKDISHIELQFKTPHSSSPSSSNDDGNCHRNRDDEATSSFKCSIVVGADGIYSSLRRILVEERQKSKSKKSSNYEASSKNGESHSIDAGPASTASTGSDNESRLNRDKNAHGLNYLGLVVILGYCPLVKGMDTFDLLNHSFRKQVQWVDGETRIFTMPFDEQHTMWQMSFPISEEGALSLSSLQKSDIKASVLERLKGWDSHLLKLIETTEFDNMSCHPAFDRDLELISPSVMDALRGGSMSASNLTFLGDAVHPMSPFKGQGANQALLDALSLSRHILSSDHVNLTRAPIHASLRSYEAEMLARSRLKVSRSRDAAMSLHSPSALKEGNITRAGAAERSTNPEGTRANH